MILNFGSINIDNVYQVSRFPEAGETISSLSYEKILGGKGINQSIAIQRAGGDVKHIGFIGDDEWILNQISSMDMKVDFISKCYGPTGHAIIFVDENGENQIIIHPGANNKFSKSQCFEILENFTSKDTWVVLQNEINLSVEIATKAKELGFKVCYSAAPFDSDHARKMLPHIDLLAMNETELKELQKSLGENVFNLDIDMILVTLGSQGAELHLGNSTIKQSSFVNKAVDTTGAGDTFLGSFLACHNNGYFTEKSLEYAAAASSIQITRIGAAKAIPTFDEVQEFINERKE